jgi:CRP/FNR family transcriptional regulator, cyclic AMP receptor protein
MAKRSTALEKTRDVKRFDPAKFLEMTAPGRVLSRHPKNEIIFAQGGDADAVFYIKKGKVKVTVVSPQGKEAVVAILGADEFVGEGCLIGQPKRLATAMAMTECETNGHLEVHSSLMSIFLKDDARSVVAAAVKSP